MEIIKPGININFISKRKTFLILSSAIIIVGIISFLIKGGLNYGIDFVGGTLVQLRFQKDIKIDEIREGLRGVDLGDSVIQHFGNEKEILIRVEKSESGLEGLQGDIKRALAESPDLGKFEVERTEMVGPQVGKDLRRKALLAISYALLGIVFYVAWRFEFKYAVAAIIALLHDVLFTLTAFSLTNREINLPIIAALLAIIGYSLNDTIVVFDRIRENLKAQKKEAFFLGGEVINNFSFALIIGVIVGTYSSIFIASPILVMWRFKSKRKAL